MSIKLNKQEVAFNANQKLLSLNALNFILSPTKTYIQEVYSYIKGSPENFTGKQLYLDILPHYYGGSTYSKSLNNGASDGRIQLVFLQSAISALDMSECDCREFIIRAGSVDIVAYGKLTVETYDDYTPPTPSPVTPTNFYAHSNGEGAQFNVTLTDGITYRTVSILDSNGLDITSGVSISLSLNNIAVDLGGSDFSCVVVYSI